MHENLVFFTSGIEARCEGEIDCVFAGNNFTESSSRLKA